MSEIQVGQINSTDGSTAITTGADGYVSFAKTQIGGRRNLIINGAMQVAQRGTSVSSVSSSGYRAVDRYRHSVSIATWTISQSTDAPDGFGYSMKMDCTTAEASPGSSDALAFVQKIEGQDLQHLKKGTASAESVTLSFWVKCTKTGTAQVNLVDEDNTRMIGQQFTVDATNTWEQKTLTFAGDTTGALGNDNNSSLRVEIWLDAGSSYKSGATPTSWEALSSTDYFAGCDLNLGDSTSNDIYITGVQLEVGSVASSYEHRSFGEELALCQRYYLRNTAGTAYTWWGSGYVAANNTARVVLHLPCNMRSSPSVAIGGNHRAYNGSSVLTVSSVGLSQYNNQTPQVDFTMSSTMTNGQAVAVGSNNDTSAYIALDAEL